MNAPLWAPSPARVAQTQMVRFLSFVNERHALNLADTAQLHAWSVSHIAAFWNAVWDFCDVVGDKGARVLINEHAMPGAQFFPDAQLNFAENLMRHLDENDALVFWGEQTLRRRMSGTQLASLVGKLQAYFRAQGVKAGDRVAAYMPNAPETIAVMLAAASLGAVFSSCSPDFGVDGVLDRFRQIEPVILVSVDAVIYNGKTIPLHDRLSAIIAQLPSLRCVILCNHAGQAPAALPGAVLLADIESGTSNAPLQFTRLSFAHPLYILFSSGTTGVPKCIVHSAGGTLLQHLKEHRLHGDIRAGDRFFYYTTCGWMMWNWLASGLASGACLLLYDGSPFAPHERILFDYAQQEHATLFGTSAKFIDAVRKTGWQPRATHDLPALRTVTSTGSPLSPESFAFVYDAIKPDLHLASISGGTDIVSCFVGGDPTKPVYAGEIQAPGLGMAVNVVDETGAPAAVGVKGELVCTRPFTAMPVGFWNDADGKKYHAAYFNRFETIWCHGDYAAWTETGGLVIYGRSDATLNPGGVRIGTAEIYAQVEKLPAILESLCVGQDIADDVRVILFVRLREGVVLDASLESKIRKTIREGASPRHVPAKIIAVSDIPRTKSGKIVELAVREVIHGRPVKNITALANPEALQLFANLPQLAVA